jgi:hypothetical protein
MSNAIEHFSRTRVDDTTLQVMADTQQGLARLIEEEQSVIRHYAQLGNWPHKRVNIFVLENLKPLVAQIKRATAVSSVVAEDVDRRPMVNVYDAADLSECAVFVNRGMLEQDGTWCDELALRALLAHEHAHPLAENDTVHAARELTVEVREDGAASKPSIGGVLHLLADHLCLHAPQEVFANEIAIRAGFGRALFHLNRGAVEKARQGVGKRPSLVQSLDKQVADGRLSAERAAALLLVGDLQAHLGFALETAAFLRAGQPRPAKALEDALNSAVWGQLDPAAKRLYEKFRDHYRRLKPDLTPAETKAWASEAVDSLADALRQRSLRVRFDVLVRTRTAPKRSRRPKSQSATAHDSALDPDGGSP